jgi:polyhydroxyalkanoate synthesis regulator phasin
MTKEEILNKNRTSSKQLTARQEADCLSAMDEYATSLKAEVESLRSQLAKAEADKVGLLEKRRRDIQAVMNDANRKFM